MTYYWLENWGPNPNVPAPAPAPAPAPDYDYTPAAAPAPAAGGVSSLVSDAYKVIGRTDPDAAGMAYWQQQLDSGALTPANFLTAFTGAAAGAGGTQYQDQAARAAEIYTNLTGTPGSGGAAPAPAPAAPSTSNGIGADTLTFLQSQFANGGRGAGGTMQPVQAPDGKWYMPVLTGATGSMEAGTYTPEQLTGWRQVGGATPTIGESTPFYDTSGNFVSGGEYREGNTGLKGLFNDDFLHIITPLLVADGVAGLQGAGVLPGAGAVGEGLTGSALDAALAEASAEALGAYGGAGANAASQVAGILEMGGTLSAADVAGIVSAAGLTGTEAAQLTAQLLSEHGIGTAQEVFRTSATTPTTPTTPVVPKGVSSLLTSLLNNPAALGTLLAALGSLGGSGGGGTKYGSYAGGIPTLQGSRQQFASTPGRRPGSRPQRYFSDMTYTGLAGGGPVPGGVGGLGDLGARMVKGPGDGVSDDVHATIDGHAPAKLARDEFVVPARVVAELGNGSSEAGAQKLYKMVDRVEAAARRAQRGKDSGAERHLPA